MRVISTNRTQLNNPIPLYDIRNTNFNNYVIRSKNGSDLIVHNCAMLDEINFGTHAKDIDAAKDQMMRLYNSVKARQQTRFTRNGKLPTLLFLISSKNSELDFLERYVQKVKNDPNVYIVDEPVWKIKPPGKFSKATFKVAVGNKYLSSKIVGIAEDTEALINQGYSIIDVPCDLRDRFEADLDEALRSLAGISSLSASRFISGVYYRRVVGLAKNPFTSDVIVMGMDDKLQLKEFFLPNLISKIDAARPIYLHIDTSKKWDLTGISAVAITGAKEMGYQFGEDDAKEEAERKARLELRYKHLFSVGIKAPSNSEISFEKTRLFIYYLKFELGWNIIEVSVDGYQSSETRQMLTKRGINCVERSLDKKSTGYDVFKLAINEQRVQIIDIPLLEKETTELERNSYTGVIDHPKDGSKDLADSLAGAVWGASLSTEQFGTTLSEDYEEAIMVNSDLGYEQAKMKRLLQDQLLNQPKNVAQHNATTLLNQLKNREPINATSMTDSQLSSYKKAVELLEPELEVFKPTYLVENDIIVI